jgi:hypothetical protein
MDTIVSTSESSPNTADARRICPDAGVSVMDTPPVSTVVVELVSSSTMELVGTTHTATETVDTTTTEHKQMSLDESVVDNEHFDKSKSYCSILNKLFLTLAVTCFVLFVCSIAFIIANRDGVSSV